MSDTGVDTDTQARIFAKTLKATREALDNAGHSHVEIGITLRFNAFINNSNRPGGFHSFPTDGEGILVD